MDTSFRVHTFLSVIVLMGQSRVARARYRPTTAVRRALLPYWTHAPESLLLPWYAPFKYTLFTIAVGH